MLKGAVCSLAAATLICTQVALLAAAERLYFIPPKVVESYEAAVAECSDWLGRVCTVIHPDDVEQLRAIL